MAVLVEAQGEILDNIENQVCFYFYIIEHVDPSIYMCMCNVRIYVLLSIGLLTGSCPGYHCG
jgi:hypothetical protein